MPAKGAKWQPNSRPAHSRQRAERSDGDGLMLSGVSRTYASATERAVHALAGVSLHAAHGELLAVVGPSGCGKTTLLELICGLQAPDGGAISCAPAALMPQRDLLLPWLDAADNAALALRIAGLSRARARSRASALFAELGLEGFRAALARRELSGRDAPARRLPAHAALGQADCCASTSRSGRSTRSRARRCRAGWQMPCVASRRTVVLVTHDVEEAVMLADRIAVLSPRPGRVIEQLEVDARATRARAPTRPSIALREHALGILSLGAAATRDVERARAASGPRAGRIARA